MKILRYRRYTPRRYIDSKKCPFETYQPKKQIRLRKENTVSIFYRIGNVFLNAGGFIGFIFYGIFKGIKEFFGIKDKVRGKLNKMGKTVEYTTNYSK